MEFLILNFLIGESISLGISFTPFGVGSSRSALGKRVCAASMVFFFFRVAEPGAGINELVVGATLFLAVLIFGDKPGVAFFDFEFCSLVT